MDIFNISPGWHTTILPLPYYSGKILSYLSLFMFLYLILSKLFHVNKAYNARLLNSANLVICILSSILLASYIFQMAIAIFGGYFHLQFSLLSESIGFYWTLYILMWIPLILTQLFWIKKNRLNANFSLLISFLLNGIFWFERFYIMISSIR